MFEFLKKLYREEMMKRVPNTAKTAPAPNIEDPKPEAPKVLTDDDKLIIKAIQKSNRFEAGRVYNMPNIRNGEYYLDESSTLHPQSGGYSLDFDGSSIAFSRNEYGLKMIAEAISERLAQNREEKRNKLNAMLGD